MSTDTQTHSIPFTQTHAYLIGQTQYTEGRYVTDMELRKTIVDSVPMQMAYLGELYSSQPAECIRYCRTLIDVLDTDLADSAKAERLREAALLRARAEAIEMEAEG